MAKIKVKKEMTLPKLIQWGWENEIRLQSFYGSNQKKEIARITKKGVYVITCGWNSGGIGKSNGFEIVEILLVPHGGWHNDTIVTVERKIK